MKKPYRPILALDFDGVIHSYTSGWKGARVISDPPVPGAIEFIIKALPVFRVAVHSSRSRQWLGRRAMRKYIEREFAKIGLDHRPIIDPPLPKWYYDFVASHCFVETWEHDIRAAAKALGKMIEWPGHKPSALITIDDRALTFDGNFGALSLDELRAFKPWNKRNA